MITSNTDKNIWFKFVVLMLSLCFLVIIFRYTDKDVFAGTITSEPDYFPLAIGNKWEFEKCYYKKGKKKSQRFSNIVTRVQDPGAGMKLYYKQNDKEFISKAKNGILTPSGIFLLKYPVKKGEKWVAGDNDSDRRLFRVTDTGFSITVRGKTYKNCVRVTAVSDFHAVQVEGKTTYFSFESQYNYAPGVGLVLVQTFRVTRSGERDIASRTELIDFKTGEPIVKAPCRTELSPKLITRRDAFRFPKSGLIWPSLSPDEKWLIYFGPAPGFWPKKRWEREIYYSGIGHSEEKLVPYCPQDQLKKERLVNQLIRWSPDGGILATAYEVGSREWIGLVDFTGGKPIFIESFEGESPVTWVSERSFLYLSNGRLMKKEIGNLPEPVVKFNLSSKSIYNCPFGRGRIAKFRSSPHIYNFQASVNGTIIYEDSGHSVYLTNIGGEPAKRVLLFPEPKKRIKKSPKKQVYIKRSPQSSSGKVIHVNGETLIVASGMPLSVDRVLRSSVDLPRLRGQDIPGFHADRVKVKKSVKHTIPKSRTDTSQTSSPKEKKRRAEFCGLKLSSEFDLSPSGRHAFFNLPKKDGKSRDMVVLVDLVELKVIDEFSMYRSLRRAQSRWSPDGSMLAYLEDTRVQPDKKDPNKNVRWNRHFFIMQVETGKKQDFGVGVSDDFNWSSDGKYIVYNMKCIHETHGYYKTGIFIMRVDDGVEIGRLTRMDAYSDVHISSSCKYIMWETSGRIFLVENPFMEKMLGDL